jgi:signal transduction histidine kinase
MNIQADDSFQSPEATVASGTRASQDFEDFIYLLSHDIRNSVRALIEVPQWIKEDLEAEGHAVKGPVADNIALMDTHTRRLDRMLIDLLVYSRVGRKQPTRTLDLADSLESVMDQRKPTKQYKITSDFSKCPSLKIGERDILTLFSELISNATKHHDKESGVVTLSSRREGDTCILRVEDDGPGIPEKFRERVLVAMATLKPRDKVEGSGMGLATVKKIADHYGGSFVWASASAPTGTAIELHFPI